MIGGLFIGFIPILPTQLTLDPDLIFFLFLPPLLYIQAFYTSWRDFRFHLRPILLLAIGLVVVTTVAVAYVAHWLIPGLPLAAAFVLGAIVSPPDAIAASAIAQRLGLPRRIVTIIEGESLVNDATSLVILKVALAAVGSTHRRTHRRRLDARRISSTSPSAASPSASSSDIPVLRPGSARRVIDDGPQIFLTVSLIPPFASYLAADQFPAGLQRALRGCHRPLSRLGIARGHHLQHSSPGPELLGHDHLPAQRHRLRPHRPATAPYPRRPYAGALVATPLLLLRLHHQCAVCILVRLAWIFPGAYAPARLVNKSVSASTEVINPDWRKVFIVGWSGMRGIVSLAAAALTLEGYPSFPRPEIHLAQFLAFSVILTTLVFQGLTLPPLIRYLGVGDDGIPAREELEARNHISEAVFEKIEEIRQREEEISRTSALDNVEQFYRERALILQDDLADQLGWSHQRNHALSVRRLNRLTIAAQRRALVGMRRAGRIGDDVMHKIEHELDLEEARLKEFNGGSASGLTHIRDKPEVVPPTMAPIFFETFRPPMRLNQRMKKLCLPDRPSPCLPPSVHRGARGDQFSQIQNDPNTYWVPAPTPPPAGYASAPPPGYYGPYYECRLRSITQPPRRRIFSTTDLPSSSASIFIRPRVPLVPKLPLGKQLSAQFWQPQRGCNRFSPGLAQQRLRTWVLI